MHNLRDSRYSSWTRYRKLNTVNTRREVRVCRIFSSRGASVTEVPLVSGARGISIKSRIVDLNSHRCATRWYGVEACHRRLGQYRYLTHDAISACPVGGRERDIVSSQAAHVRVGRTDSRRCVAVTKGPGVGKGALVGRFVGEGECVACRIKYLRRRSSGELRRRYRHHRYLECLLIRTTVVRGRR